MPIHSESTAGADRSPRLAALALTAEACASSLLGWMLATLSIGLLSLYFSDRVWTWTAALALLAIPVMALWQAREQADGRVAAAAGAVLALLSLGASAWFSAGYFDVSWDGVSYHQQAILHMVEGWPQFPQQLPDGTLFADWIDYYAKAIWVIAAAVFALTGSIESAMGLHTLLMLVAGLLLLAGLLRCAALPTWAAALLALVAAANPVALYQSLSFYVDGPLASLLVACAGLMLLLINAPRTRQLWLLGAVIVLLINVKHTGIAYGGLFVLALLFAVWRLRPDWLKRAFLAAAIGGVLGAGAFGWSPYVTNTFNYGHPLYPILGNSADFDIASNQRPEGFDAMNRFQRLWIGTWARPSIALRGAAETRWPGAIRSEDLTQVRTADVRLGGWGSLFVEALALALLGLLALRKVPVALRIGAGALLLASLVATVISTDAWWARYSPQWFFVPVLIAAMLLGSAARSSRGLGVLLLVLLLANLGTVAAGFYPHQRQQSDFLRDYLGQIKATGGVVIVYFGGFPSNRLRLQAAGIPYMEVKAAEHLPCSDPQRIFNYEGLYCLRQ